MPMTSIALRLALLRSQRGIPQRRLAKIIGVSDTALSAWECGDRTPRLEHAIAWARSLGLQIQLKTDAQEDAEECRTRPQVPQGGVEFPMSVRQVA